MHVLVFSLLLLPVMWEPSLLTFEQMNVFTEYGSMFAHPSPGFSYPPAQDDPGKPMYPTGWDKGACFPGATTPPGLEALQRFVWQHVRWASLSTKEGRVYPTFTVDEQGQIRRLRILKGLDASHDQELLRVLRGMPRWKPASLRGKPVAQPITVPILFTQAARRDWAK